MLRKQLRKRDTYMRDWSTALGRREGWGQKRDCFGEHTSCRVAFEGKTVISPIVQSPGSDCQAVPRNPGSSISSGQTVRSSHQKDFFLIVRGVKFPWAAVGG